ncbi:MOSC domain-containing protein YiiM [Luteibacter sp. UNCMF331Sha3.1]|uniref:MOSC and FAD-binding oxidoreductase domain-containing protein n=1 Tax=Luteibacter sp. UNCMF331Sha3.1 TaxID=1502760 RepID=UPI0008C27078|nr:MOSC and FAD-binding oxidoreductase domain-containing protein [Luteibacter sp. UNCMF331Sha3.1]SEM19422.1 MOSC domain-containing protein YiiM [Luteibacter sp. UNCMF331Sha3.1]
MAILVSVNVGGVRDLDWGGRRVPSGIDKRPVDGPVAVGAINLAGDDQADRMGHGGEHRAVLVYQMASYRHWAAFLQRDDLEPGGFGENLTVDGLSDEEVAIGDRFAIGSAVFEVTQPRVTCYKLGARLKRHDMPALLVAHRRPGFYMRVIRQGTICAGDTIARVATAATRMSVADIDTLLYREPRPRDLLERAIAIPALSEGWRGSFRGYLNTPAVEVSTPAWPGFRGLRLLSRTPTGSDICAFVLGAPDGTPLPRELPGQHVAVRLRHATTGQVSVRMYSLCGGPPGTYRIGVKRIEGGVSAWLHDHLAVGDSLDTSAPRGTFLLESDDRPVVLVAAGVGVTPMLSMLRAVCGDATRRAPVWWIQAVRDGAHLPFNDEVETLLASAPRARRLRFFSAPSEADVPGVAFEHAGRLTLDVLTREGVPLDAAFYVCGPDAMMTAMGTALRNAGASPAAIHQETFGSLDAFAPGLDARTSRPPHAPEGEQGGGPSVTFARSRLTVPWQDRFASLLELAEACDVPVRWSCRTGVCHNCQTPMLDGDVTYAPEPLAPPDPGQVLLCCARPKAAIELDL